MPPICGPQVEDGNFTRIHNALLCLLALLPFTAREYKVLLHIIRQTYGYQRVTTRLTVTEVATATRLTNQAVRATISALEIDRVLLVKGLVSGGKPLSIGLNKYFQKWRGDKDVRLLTDRAAYQLGTQAGTQPGMPAGTQPGKKRGPKPAPAAGPGEPKESKENKDNKETPNHVVASSRVIFADPRDPHAPDTDAMGEAITPNASDSLVKGHAAPREAITAKTPPPSGRNDGPTVGMPMLVAQFLAVYERGGGVLPGYVLQDLRDLLEATGIGAVECAAHIAAWANTYRTKGKKPPRIASPSYFLPVIQAAAGLAAKVHASDEAFGDYV
jgi:phage replication O-like protein O